MLTSSLKFDLTQFQEETCPRHSHLNTEIKGSHSDRKKKKNKNTANMLAKYIL